MKISSRLYLILGTVFLLCACSIVFLVSHQMRNQALHEAESKALIILDRDLATHDYFQHELKPKLFKWSDAFRSEDFFDPSWMSSTYVIRQIDRNFKLLNPGNYYDKTCAVDARNPENEADDYERPFLEELNRNPSVVARSCVRFFDGQPYFVVMRRGLLMEQHCLKCHGNPKDAPRDMIRHYGAERSFHRRVGETVSAISIRIPLTAAYRQTEAFSWKLSGILLIALAFLFIVQHWVNNRLLLKPLGRMHEKALQIAASDEHLGEEIPLPQGQELRELTEAFNLMSERLRERNDELRRLNIQLQLDIARRERAEEALRESEACLCAAIESLPFDFWIRNPRGQFVLQNSKSRENYGDMIGKQPEEVCVDEAVLAAWQRTFQRAMAGELTQEEVEYRTPAGKKTYHNVVAPVLDGEQTLGILSANIDITERKNAEEELLRYREHLENLVEYRTTELRMANEQLRQEVAERRKIEEVLRESEERYRSLIETAHEGIWVIDADGNTTFINDKMTHLLGYSAEEIAGKSFFDFMNDEWKTVAESFLERRRGGIREQLDFKFLRKDGSELWAIVSTNPLFAKDGRYAGALALITDITDRKAAEEALLKSEEKFRNIYQESPIGIELYNAQGELIDINRSCLEMFGILHEEEVLGFQLHRDPNVPEEIMNRVRRGEMVRFETTFDFDKIREMNLYATHKQGIAWLDVLITPLRTAGILGGYLVQIQDITERKRSEQTLRESEKQLRFLSTQLLSAQEEERVRMAREVHDSIGSSLTGIKISLENLLCDFEKGVLKPESIQVLITTAQNSIRECRRIMTDLRPSILDDYGIVATTEWLCEQFQAIYRNILIHKTLDIQEKDVPENLKIILFRIMQEALNNTAKYSKAQSVHLLLRKRPECIELRIEDDGVGFDPASVLAKSNCEKGVGLTSMKERAELFGGIFSIFTAPGKGTSIRVSWPCETLAAVAC